MFKNISENELIPTIGRNIRLYRTKKNMTQTDLAFNANTEIAHISSIELGKRKLLSVLVLYRIAIALDVTLDLLAYPLFYNSDTREC